MKKIVPEITQMEKNPQEAKKKKPYLETILEEVLIPGIEKFGKTLFNGPLGEVLEWGVGTLVGLIL
jgi:hypothetical protein